MMEMQNLAIYHHSIVMYIDTKIRERLGIGQDVSFLSTTTLLTCSDAFRRVLSLAQVERMRVLRLRGSRPPKPKGPILCLLQTD